MKWFMIFGIILLPLSGCESNQPIMVPVSTQPTNEQILAANERMAVYNDKAREGFNRLQEDRKKFQEMYNRKMIREMPQIIRDIVGNQYLHYTTEEMNFIKMICDEGDTAIRQSLAAIWKHRQQLFEDYKTEIRQWRDGKDSVMVLEIALAHFRVESKRKFLIFCQQEEANLMKRIHTEFLTPERLEMMEHLKAKRNHAPRIDFNSPDGSR